MLGCQFNLDFNDYNFRFRAHKNENSCFRAGKFMFKFIHKFMFRKLCINVNFYSQVYRLNYTKGSSFINPTYLRNLYFK